MRIIWVMAILLIGPIGLLAYLLSYRGPLRTADPVDSLTNARCAFGSVATSLLGPAVGMLLGFIILVLAPTIGQTPLEMVLVFYSLPFLFGLLAFRTPLMVFVRGKGFWDALRKAVPAEMISVNLILLGMFPATVVPITLLNTLPIPDVSNPANPLFWIIFVVAALVSLIIGYPAHFWMVKGDLVPWHSLVAASGSAELIAVREPSTSWVRILLVVLATYVILFVAVYWLLSLM
jgi:hypothetical protein